MDKALLDTLYDAQNQGFRTGDSFDSRAWLTATEAVRAVSGRYADLVTRNRTKRR